MTSINFMMITLTTERLIIAWGIILSVFISVITFGYEVEKDNFYFKSSASKIFNEVESAFANVNRINREFNSLFYLLDDVNDDEFRLLAGSLLRQNEFIGLIYFAEKIHIKDELKYERTMQNKGYTGFTITSWDGNALKKTPEAKFLFPIKYIEPYNVKNSRWFGRDLLSFPVVHNTINAANGNSKSLVFLPAKKEKNRLFAVQVLFNGYDDNLKKGGLNNAFGVLVYKINLHKMILLIDGSELFNTLRITLDDHVILQGHNIGVDSILSKNFEISKEIYLGKKKLKIQIIRNKGLFSFDLKMTAIVLIAGLFLTLFIWHIIRTHLEHNKLLAEQKKLIEDEVKAKTKELSKKTNELTTAYNQQLVLSEELEAFSYSVSHDLRAPLRSLDGFSRALEEDYSQLFDETAKDYLERICKASQRMGTLIDALLSLSRITRKGLLLEHFSVTDMATVIVSNLRGEFPERNIDIIINDNLDITADKSLLYVVFDNLIRNAWKYTKDKEKARIEIGMEFQDGDKIFYVKDNGVGFEMAYSERLFGSFQRLHHQRDFEGDGIGLATAKRIILRHRGKIWARAEVDKGATFYFTLPRLKNDFKDESLV